MPQGSLRLLMLAAQYFPAVGGSEAQARLLAREFRRRGHAVEVWTRRLEVGHARSETLDGILVRRLGPILGAKAASLERQIFFYRLYRELRSRARSFDVILANQLQYPAVAAVLALRGTGIPVVARSAASGPDSEMHRKEWSFRFQRWLLTRYLDRVVALGPATRDDCVAAGFQSSLVSIVPNGLEVQTVPRPRDPVPPLFVVWLGKFRKEKRADLAVHAWREARIPGELRVVGDGPLRRSLEEQIGQDGGVGPSGVRMTGLMEDPGSELAAAHVFLQSSDTEGLSNALLEAMCAGCACVATDVGDTRFVLGGAGEGDVPAGSFLLAEAGLLVRPGDVMGMAMAMRALLDPALRDTLGRAGEARVRANHGMGLVAQRYEELFFGLVSSGQRPCPDSSP